MDQIPQLQLMKQTNWPVFGVQGMQRHFTEMEEAMIRGEYTALEATEIRLLCLASDLGDAISGQLETVTLEDAPPYYALSHAWVSDEPRDVVLQSGLMRLGSNLSACIRRVRELDVRWHQDFPEVNYIWLDSICINQEDALERSCQVSLMGRIYSQSIRTIIWLGEPESPSIHCAWQLIGDIHSVFRHENPTATAVSDIRIRVYDERHHAATGLPGWGDVRWKYLRKLMNVRWFSRMWIVQEVVLSPRDPIILHGEYRYAWEYLGWAVAWIRRSGYMRLPQMPEQLRNVDTISDLRRSHTRWPLEALMSITQIKFHATDQRDKVYGLLGLAAECQCQDDSAMPDELKPDYNIDVATLYNRVARFLLRKSSSLAILTRLRGLEGTHTRTQRQYDLALPSWCPDWSDFTTYNMGISTSLSWIEYAKSSSPVTFDFPTQYAASCGLKLDFEQAGQAAKDDSILQIGGFIIDEVKNVQRVEISRHLYTDRPGIDNLNTRMALVLRLGLSLISSSDIIAWAKVFIRSTTANQCRLNGTSESQGFADGAAWLCAFLQNNRAIAGLATKNDSAALTQLRKASIKGIPEHYVTLVRNFCFDRTFIITRDCRMGIAPSNTRPGDAILILPGGGVPYLAKRSEKYWFLIGESYIDGLMSGEAIEYYKKGLVQKQTFSFK